MGRNFTSFNPPECCFLRLPFPCGSIDTGTSRNPLSCKRGDHSLRLFPQDQDPPRLHIHGPGEINHSHMLTILINQPYLLAFDLSIYAGGVCDFPLPPFRQRRSAAVFHKNIQRLIDAEGSNVALAMPANSHSARFGFPFTNDEHIGNLAGFGIPNPVTYCFTPHVQPAPYAGG